MSFINNLIPLVLGLALLFFMWGIAKFIYSAGDAGKHEDGKQMMIWSIVALFIMVSYLAILAAAHRDIGFGAFGQPRIRINSN